MTNDVFKHVMITSSCRGLLRGDENRVKLMYLFPQVFVRVLARARAGLRQTRMRGFMSLGACVRLRTFAYGGKRGSWESGRWSEQLETEYGSGE